MFAVVEIKKINSNLTATEVNQIEVNQNVDYLDYMYKPRFL